jgi:hypothetical protein
MFLRGVRMWFVEDKQKENTLSLVVSPGSGGITGQGGRAGSMPQRPRPWIS